MIFLAYNVNGHKGNLLYCRNWNLVVKLHCGANRRMELFLKHFVLLTCILQMSTLESSAPGKRIHLKKERRMIATSYCFMLDQQMYMQPSTGITVPFVRLHPGRERQLQKWPKEQHPGRGRFDREWLRWPGRFNWWRQVLDVQGWSGNRRRGRESK